MFYRIRIDLAFPDEPPPGRIKELAATLLSRAITIKPGLPDQERGFVLMEKCYHDENPTRPCELITILETPL